MDKWKMNEMAEKLLGQEIKAMEQLRHPNIIRIFECLETASRVHLAMECAGFRELYSHIHNRGKIFENECKPIFAQIVSAVPYMHSKSIIRRDMKAENVLTSVPGWIKLADFGFACEVNPNDMLTTFCGSPACPPATFERKLVANKRPVQCTVSNCYHETVTSMKYSNTPIAQISALPP